MRKGQLPSATVNNPAFQAGFKQAVKWIEDAIENKFTRLEGERFYIEARDLDDIIVIAHARAIKWARRASNTRAKNIRSLRANRGTIPPHSEGHA